MSEYKDYIESLANSSCNEEFYNSGPEHAKIVLSTIFNTAKMCIQVYCANLQSLDVSNSPEYIAAVKKFLGKQSVLAVENPEDRPLQIILANPALKSLPEAEIYKVFQEYPNKVALKRVVEGVPVQTYNDNPVHFTVADNKMYRMETDLANKKAYGNFNDPEGARTIHDVFVDLFRSQDKTQDINILPV